MKRTVEIVIRLGAIGAAIWAASGAALYALFIGLCYSQRYYALFPALIVALYLAQVRFIFRPVRASFLCGLASRNCYVCIVGRGLRLLVCGPH